MSIFIPQNPGIGGLDELTLQEELAIQAIASLGTAGQVLRTNTGETGVEWFTLGAGAGDVVGPASATDNAIVRFDSTTGKLIQNSIVTVGDTGGISTTIAGSGNSVGLSITQNDTTNNPRAVSITNTGTAASLFIDPNGASSASTSVGGAILLENTGNTGAGFIIYSNAGASSGRLMNIRADNASFDQPCLHIDNDGTTNAFEILHNSTDSSANAISVVSVNPNDSTVGITGQETGKGTMKITHKYTGTADGSSAALSILLDGTSAGTASQGIFIDSTSDQATSGNLLTLRNNGVNQLTLGPTGITYIAGSIELGHASDTTISRASAGVIAVEGVNLLRVGDVTTNATHTGEVTGATTLTIDKTAITGKTAVTADAADYVLISDTSDTGNLKKALVSDFGGGTGNVTKVGTPADNQIGVWTGDGTIEGTTGLTYDGNTLIATGATATGYTLINVNTDVGQNGSFIQSYHNSPSPANGDYVGGWDVYGNNSIGTKKAFGYINIIANNITNGAEESSIVQSIVTSGTISERVVLNGQGFNPVTNGLTKLGNTSQAWSGLVLSSGAIINWNAGNATLTHSTGLLTSNVPISLGTSNALTAGTIELGHASDTTLSRSAAGVLAVEGNNLRAVKVTSTSGPGATPTIATIPNATNIVHFTALATAITSMTTNLSGTPTEGDVLRIDFTDNGTARAITWGASFEASTVALPTTTVVSTRLDVGFFWNTVTSKWRVVAVA